MAQPTRFWTVQPADISSGATIPLDRYTTLDEANQALLTVTAKTGKQHVVLECVKYIDWPLTTAQVNSLVLDFV